MSYRMHQFWNNFEPKYFFNTEKLIQFFFFIIDCVMALLGIAQLVHGVNLLRNHLTLM